MISGQNINLYPIQSGDLNTIKLKNIKNFLKSDLFIILVQVISKVH